MNFLYNKVQDDLLNVVLLLFTLFKIILNLLRFNIKLNTKIITLQIYIETLVEQVKIEFNYGNSNNGSFIIIGR